MSLDNIIDNILQIARNNNVAESEHLSRHQIELWIKYYRALLIKREIDKGYDLDEAYISTIEPIHLDRQETAPGKFLYVGEEELPTLIGFKYRPGVVAVRDMYGNLIQLGHQTKSLLQKYRKATCKDYIAWVKGNKIYVEGDSNQLEWISVDVIAEDPTEDKECYDPSQEYPIPGHMISVVVQMILQNELNVLVSMPSDQTNDSHDDNQNRFRRSR